MCNLSVSASNLGGKSYKLKLSHKSKKKKFCQVFIPFKDTRARINVWTLFLSRSFQQRIFFVIKKSTLENIS